MNSSVIDTSVEPGAAFALHQVEVDGLPVRYFEAGSGEPLVVLHGAGGPRHSAVLDALATTRRVILVEMPGFGEVADETHTDRSSYAETVARAIAEIGIDRYQLFGTSFGGAVAVDLAALHPDRIASLVLEAPAAFRVGGADPSTLAPEQMLAAFRVHPERPPAFGAPDPEKQAQVWPLVTRLLGGLPPDDPDFEARVNGLQVRTLVLFGDRDGIVHPDNGRTFRRILPNSALIYVHDAAHDIQGDRPQAFVEVVSDFLDRGWEFLLPEESTLINP